MDSANISELLKAFEGYDFRLEDYTKDGGKTVMGEAEEYLGMMLPEVSAETVRQFLSFAVRQRCLELLLDKMEWSGPPPGYRSAVECTLDKRRLKGSVTIEPKKIHVEIPTGEGVATKECILLDWAPKLFTEDPFVGSPACREGRRKARELFASLCLECLSAGRQSVGQSK